MIWYSLFTDCPISLRKTFFLNSLCSSLSLSLSFYLHTHSHSLPLSLSSSSTTTTTTNLSLLLSLFLRSLSGPSSHAHNIHSFTRALSFSSLFTLHWASSLGLISLFLRRDVPARRLYNNTYFIFYVSCCTFQDASVIFALRRSFEEKFASWRYGKQRRVSLPPSFMLSLSFSLSPSFSPFLSLCFFLGGRPPPWRSIVLSVIIAK